MRSIASRVLLLGLLFAGESFGAGAAWSTISNACLARCERLCAVRPDKAACLNACRSSCAVSQADPQEHRAYRHGYGYRGGDAPAPDESAPQPAQPAAPPVTHHRAARKPSSRIIDTRSAPLAHPGEEPEGFGLYTYVLIRHSADRDSRFLQEIVRTAPSAAGVAPPLRAQIDLMLIPAKPCPANTTTSATTCAPPEPEAIAADLKANYNFEESNTILEGLCANPPEQVVKFCRAPFGEGPFLFTYARPVSKMNSIPPPFLFFDFTDQDEAAFPDYINAYEAVLKSDDFTDDSKLKTLRLRILDVYNRARAAAGPTAEGAAKLIHLFFPGG
jgi:hypothetical protein